MLKFSLQKMKLLIPAVLSSALLVACGGGDDTPAPAAPAPVASQTLSGVAAVGAPIVNGTVNVSCAAGSGFSATTGSAGQWSVTSSGQTLPCAVQVSGGTVGGVANTTSYQSIATTFGNINVTPLTSLVVAQLAGSDPVNWFRTPVFTGINADSIAAAVRSVSTSLGLTTTLGSINPLTDTFKAENGDKLDDILEALKTALATASKTYADLLAAASSRNYAGFTGFGASFSTAYAGISGGGSGGTGGGATSCSAGQTLMVFATENSALYKQGEKVCFGASPTSLSFSGKTLSSPVQNTMVSAPFAAYKFTDAGEVAYEVVLKNGALYEINVLTGTKFTGQFGPDTTLVVEVIAGGIAAPAVTVSGVHKPDSQDDFCGTVEFDSNLRALQANGGTLTINSCSFSANVGTISATLKTTVPVALSVAYSVKYTYK